MAHKKMRTIMAPSAWSPEARKTPWCKIENADRDIADVYIFDDIGYDWWTDGGVTSKQFAKDLASIKSPVVNVHINSNGGDAFEGVAIYNTLVQHPAQIHVIIDGIAASAASLIAMAGDMVTMRTGSEMMIHTASTLAWGNAQELGKVIGMLDSVDESIASIYADKSGETTAHWVEAMKAETWYTAAEAVAAGLADEVAGKATDVADSARMRSPNFAGRADAVSPSCIVSAYVKIFPSFVVEDSHQTPKKKGVVMDDLKAALAAALGLDATATDEEVVEAVVDLATAPKPVEDTTSNTTVPEGAVVVDAGILDELRAQASAGAQAKGQLDTQRRDGLISAAKAEGRISAATEKVWRARLEADEEGTTALLATLPANVIPVQEIGYQGGTEDTDPQDALYKSVTGFNKTKKEG